MGTADTVYMVMPDGSWRKLPLTHAQFQSYRQALEKYADAKIQEAQAEQPSPERDQGGPAAG